MSAPAEVNSCFEEGDKAQVKVEIVPEPAHRHRTVPTPTIEPHRHDDRAVDTAPTWRIHDRYR
jgi:hypothetical protein